MAFSSESIKVFLAVLDRGSFSAAARALKRAPSAVSMMIAQIEAELGFDLFDRTAREAIATDFALSLEPLARQIASQMRQLQTHALALHQGLESRLIIAIASELLYTPWNQALATLANEFPTLELSVLAMPQSEAINTLNNGDAHLALIFERSLANDREAFQELGKELLVAVISHSHPKSKDGETKFLREDFADVRQIVVAGPEADRSDLKIQLADHIWYVDSHLAALRLIQAGLGWAFLPQTLVLPLFTDGKIKKIKFENMSNQLEMWVDVVWLKDKQPGIAGKRLIKLLKEHFSSYS